MLYVEIPLTLTQNQSKHNTQCIMHTYTHTHSILVVRRPEKAATVQAGLARQF